MVGNGFMHFARAWFDDVSVTRVFEPLVADWQRECSAVSGARHAWCRVRGYGYFVIAVLLTLPRQVQQRLPERVTLSGWLLTELFALLGILAQIVFIQTQAEVPFILSGASYLVPATGVTAISLALIPAAIILMRMPQVRVQQARIMVLRLALIAMVLVAPVITWMVPASNQAWRKERFQDRGGIAQTAMWRGVRELTVPELLAAQPPTDLGERPEQWGQVRVAELRARASVLMMPITMAILGVALGAFVRRRGVLSAVGWWLAATMVCLLDIEAIWITHAVPLGLAAVITWQTRRRLLTVPF